MSRPNVSIGGRMALSIRQFGAPANCELIFGEPGSRASIPRFDTVKVFSGTTNAARSSIGERVAEWFQTQPSLRLVDAAVVQSSDSRFHCFTIVLFIATGRDL